LGLRVERVEKRKAEEVGADCFYRYHWERRRLRTQGIEGSCRFPSTPDIVAAARATVPELYRQLRSGDYLSRFAPRLDALMNQSVRNAWLQLGWRPRAGDWFTSEELFDRVGITDQHRRLATA